LSGNKWRIRRRWRRRRRHYSIILYRLLQYIYGRSAEQKSIRHETVCTFIIIIIIIIYCLSTRVYYGLGTYINMYNWRSYAAWRDGRLAFVSTMMLVGPVWTRPVVCSRYCRIRSKYTFAIRSSNAFFFAQSHAIIWTPYATVCLMSIIVIAADAITAALHYWNKWQS